MLKDVHADISELTAKLEQFKVEQKELVDYKHQGQATLGKMEVALEMLQDQVTAIIGRSNVSQTQVSGNVAGDVAQDISK